MWRSVPSTKKLHNLFHHHLVAEKPSKKLWNWIDFSFPNFFPSSFSSSSVFSSLKRWMNFLYSCCRPRMYVEFQVLNELLIIYNVKRVIESYMGKLKENFLSKRRCEGMIKCEKLNYIRRECWGRKWKFSLKDFFACALSIVSTGTHVVCFIRAQSEKRNVFHDYLLVWMCVSKGLIGEGRWRTCEQNEKTVLKWKHLV